MISQTIVHEEHGTAATSSPERFEARLGPLSILLLSGWCGLVAGLLEVAVTVVRQANGRPESVLLDEPTFRLADPAGRSADLSGTGGCCCRSCSDAGAVAAGSPPRLLCDIDLASARLGGFSADFRSAGLLPGGGGRDADGTGPRAAGGPPAAAGPAQLSNRRRCLGLLWRLCPGARNGINEWREGIGGRCRRRAAPTFS